MILNDRSSAISLLETRRSGKPRELVAPGPTRDELDHILTIAMRTPDHGKIAPWRFVIVGPQQRQQLADLQRAEQEARNRFNEQQAKLLQQEQRATARHAEAQGKAQALLNAALRQVGLLERAVGRLGITQDFEIRNNTFNETDVDFLNLASRELERAIARGVA